VLYAIGVAIFALGLLLSIALHEVGHMVPAKKFGVKVTQYMVGFGPTLWSRKRGDTEYGVKAIPLGGYIRMIGMVPPRRDGTQSRWPRRWASAIEDFRRMSRADVLPGDGDREFYRLTPGKKIIVMLGGPCMNLLIYLVLMVVLLSTIGLSSQTATQTIGSVSKCVVPVTAPAAKQNDCAQPNSPAALAGLRAGDKIVAINGVAMASFDAAVKVIEASPNKQLSMTVIRDGNPVQLSITPVDNLKAANDSGTKTKVAGFIGVAPVIHDYYQPLGVTGIAGQVGHQIRLGVDAIGSYPKKIGSLWDTVFNNKPRDINGAVGVVGIGRIGGSIAESKHLDVQDKVSALVSLLAIVNLLLFFFNLLPLLPLDGGHVAGALVEAAKRGRARLRRRVPVAADGLTSRADGTVDTTQHHVDTAQMLPVMYLVGSVLILLTLLTLYADIVKPINLNG
jgi:membrane-associated protease RseP (regulator of RpoE activity)